MTIPESVKQICKNNTSILDVPEVIEIIELYNRLVSDYTISQSVNGMNFQAMSEMKFENERLKDEIRQLKSNDYITDLQLNCLRYDEHITELKKQMSVQKQMITDLSLLNEKQHHLLVQTIRQKDIEYSKLKKKYKKLEGDKSQKSNEGLFVTKPGWYR